jgi:hypothetical protein
MPEITDLFNLYSRAAETLLKEFSDRKSDLYHGETVTQFDFSHSVESLEWLDERLPILVESLFPAGFKLQLSIMVQDFQTSLLLREDDQHLWVDVDSVGEYAGNYSLETLPEAGMPLLLALQEQLHAARGGFRWDELYSQLEALSRTGTQVKVELSLFLDKRAVQRRFLAGLQDEDHIKLLVFLFSKSLVRALGRVSLQILEQEYFLLAKRSVWLVFSLQGCLVGEYLSVFGKGVGDKMEQVLLNGRLSQDIIQSNFKVINLRRRTGIWADPPRWLTPQVFDQRPYSKEDEFALRELHAHLQSTQALLSALYLADQVEVDEDCFRVSYRGLGSASIWLTRSDMDQTNQAEDLYSLFDYAYTGFSPDKVEIAQQFLSLMVETPASLLQKAAEVRDATQKTYQERVLVERVSDYFEARHKVQERLRAATDAASTGVIELSREISGDVYKIAGVVGAAIVAALIQPDITLFAILAAGGVMVLYLALVLFYHLPTLQRANQLSYKGHEAGIRSFGDVLSVSELEGFLQDEQLRKAQTLLEQAIRRARTIYLGFLFVVAFILLIVITTTL